MSGSGPSFPSNPTVGQIYTYGTQSWQWNGTAWVNATTGANFLPLTGGTMAAPGTISGATLEQPVIMGVTDGSNAPAGAIGEVISELVSPSFSFASNLPYNGATISLTPGDWDVSAFAVFGVSQGASTLFLGISQQSGELPTLPTINGSTVIISTATGSLGTSTLSPMTCRFNFTSTTTVYLVFQATFTTGTVAFNNGGIWARRMR